MTTNKIVCYTCITNNYDKLLDPLIIPKNIDFICFTDQPNAIKSKYWKIVPIPANVQYLSPIIKQRLIKIRPHSYLSEYDISIWVDGNIQIIGDLNKVLEKCDFKKSSIWTRIHPCRKCIYDEAQKCLELNKGDPEKINSQIKKYRQQNYPEKAGLAETGIMIRYHNNFKCITVCNEWASEIIEESTRDQLSFNYVCWKERFLPEYIVDETFLEKSTIFKIHSHCRQITQHNSNFQTLCDINLQQTNKVFFKIIVPNYNNMPYIKKCLDSILKQTFQDFKIIVVDDLSTDGSDKFCEEYAKQFPDKIIYHQLETKGYAGAARNYGINYNIDSFYTWFIDSDDYIYDKNTLTIMHSILSKTYPDILECAYIKHKKDTDKYINVSTDITTLALAGAWPSKHCISSKFKCQFKEQRAKNNDIIWFIRLLEQINPNKIEKIDAPCFIYNCTSITSCQNSEVVKNSYACQYAVSMILHDVNEETITKPYVIKYKEKLIQMFNNIKPHPKLTVDDIFKYAFVISIDMQKYTTFCKIFSKHGFNTIPQLKIGSQDKTKSGPWNCRKSHYDLILYAKQQNFPYICIFEDDAYPCIDCKDKFQEYLNILENDYREIDFILLGWSNHSQTRKYKKYTQSFNEKLNKITTIISGSHSYILFNKQFDYYLQYFDQYPDQTADCEIFMKIPNNYVLDSPLFIQYSNTTSMNNHIGYIFYGDHIKPPKNFKTIDNYI